jgi:hypothetical protein
MSENKGLARLREPFAANQINVLPKAIAKGGERYQCRQGTQASADGKYCGGYHARSIHLDYVGHAALTDRLLEVDPEWQWEPLATGPDGLPVFDNYGGLWIKLTICGVTRMGYGDAQGKDGSNAVKEAIGDALRNAGMRFGAALDLWHKGDLHDAKAEQGNLPADEPKPQPKPRTVKRETVPKEALKEWQRQIDECQDMDDFRALHQAASADGAPDQVLAMIVDAGKKMAA